MLLQRVIREDVHSQLALEEYGLSELLRARENFWEYRITMNPRLRLRDMWFPRSLSRKLRLFFEDYKNGKRPVLLIETPPQHGKSISVIDFLAWIVGHDPRLRIIYMSFSDRLSIRANLRMQRALDSEMYQRIFGKRLADRGLGAAAALRNYDILEFLDSDGEGYFRNTTVLGSITGESLDVGVIDDPIKGRMEANSLNNRDKVWSWLTDDVFSRFSDNAGLLMILTRWHLDDPAGRLIEQFKDRVMVARYPALAEVDELYRKAGEPLFPQLKSLEFLQQRRQTMTQSSWEALYQQNPIVVGGGIFPIDKISILPERPAAASVMSAARYWDKAGCLLAGTMITTLRGDVPIEDVCVGELVLTQYGYQRVESAWLSGYTDELTTVVFSDGTEITGTPDHPVYVSGGYWIGLATLVGSDCVFHRSELASWRDPEIERLKKFSFRGGAMSANQEHVTSIVMRGTKLERSMFTTRCIEKSGSRSTARFPLAVISTTRTTTGLITESRILSASQRPNIGGTTHPIFLSRLHSQIQSIEEKHSRVFAGEWRDGKRTSVPSAVVRSKREASSRNIASDALVSECGGVPVFDLTVTDAHAFFANGILVHNTEGGGAYSAGVLMLRMMDGNFVVADVRRGQWSALDRERVIKQTAAIDHELYQVTKIFVEQEPGSGGKESAEASVRMLAGYAVEADKVTGAKELRADPFAAQWQAGNVRLVAAPWNKAYLDEHEVFPNGKYMDQVDASSGAFNKIASKYRYNSSLDWVRGA